MGKVRLMVVFNLDLFGIDSIFYILYRFSCSAIGHGVCRVPRLTSPPIGIRISLSHVHQSFNCLQTSVDDVNDYNRIISKLHQPNERVHIQAGFKLAPPTRNPSTSASLARSRQFFSLTEPP